MDDDLTPVLYVATYSDAAAARDDWAGVKRLVKDQLIPSDALVLVTRDAHGKLDVSDTARGPSIGAKVGGLGGALLGLILPQAMIASAIIGAGLGAGAGAVVDRVSRHEVTAGLEQTLPPGGSAIVAVIEQRWVGAVGEALARADSFEQHRADELADADAPDDVEPS
jgi:uncharacterized membrane protein